MEATPEDRTARAAETEAFWDWALLELLLQSGVRIEEACELTTALRRSDELTDDAAAALEAVA